MTADLALAADPGFLERSADPAEFVIQACERAKVWLREALDNGDIDQIVEVKSQAEAVRVYTMQKQLGKDAQLSAQEIVRRAERGIGVAIRKGQAAGIIRKRGDDARTDLDRETNLVSAKSYFSNGDEWHDTYVMTDGVSDSEFDNAVTEARTEGNLSRANVIRKISSRKPAAGDWIPEPGDNHGEAPAQRRRLIRAWAERGYSSRQMSEMLSMRSDAIREIAREMGVEIGADAIIGKTRIHDSNRIVRETVHALEGLVMGLDLVSFDDLDPAETGDWAASLTDSTRRLNRFLRQMKEATQ